MKNKMLTYKKHKPLIGFTVIELVVVIAIIAILSVIIISNVMNYVAMADEAAVKANLHNLAVTASQYIADNGGASAFCTSPGDENTASAIQNINSGYTFNCTDGTSHYTPPGSGVGEQFNGNGVNGTSLCSPNKWYAFTQGIKDSSGCWCIDSQGNTEDSCGVADDCACN